MSFMGWQLNRGVVAPLSGRRPGSPWWRAVNERLVRDGCEAVALSGGAVGPASSPSVDFRVSFADDPSARSWYRAHNASVVAGYLEHRTLAETETAAERFFPGRPDHVRVSPSPARAARGLRHRFVNERFLS
jgi:hypothetical protein